MWRILLLTFLVAVVLQHILTVVYIMGYHKHTYKHRPGNCKVLNGIDNGSEDIELMSDGMALISSGVVEYNGVSNGNIYAVNLASAYKALRVVNVTFSKTYSGLENAQPHGMSIFEDKKSGKKYVFIIVHRARNETVDIFEFQKKRKTLTLHFLRSVQDPLMRSMNDICAVGRNEFYFTNDGFNKDPTARTLERYMMFPWGGVVFCDKEGCRHASSPLFEPNGIQMSKDGKYIYVALFFGMSIHVYERNIKDNTLSSKPIQTINVGSAVDNLFVDFYGNLWTGNHPVLHKLRQHTEDRRKPSPSQVMKIKFGKDNSYELYEIYSDDGSQISASSVAVGYGDKMLIGTILTKLVACDVKLGYAEASPTFPHF